MRGLLLRLRLRQQRDPRFAVVEPTHFGVRLEDHRLQHQQPRRVVDRVGAGLELRVLLQRTQRLRALDLDDAVDVHARRRQRERELDRQLVARARLTPDRLLEPLRDLVTTRVRDPVLHPALDRLAQRLHEAVALEPAERRVDLPDVQRPGRAGRRVELTSELVAVHRRPSEEREKATSDRHTYGVCILSMYGSRGGRRAGPQRRPPRKYTSRRRPPREAAAGAERLTGSWWRA